MLALLFFLVGCGGDNSKDDNDDDPYVYNGGNASKNDSDADSDKKNDDDDTSDSANDDDTDDASDTENNEDNNNDSGGFWSTCEGIISCTTACRDDDSDCFTKCINKGSDQGQRDYRDWRQCFEENCAEDKTAECSAEKCAEWDTKCNVAQALEYEFIIPAPYGSAVFAGSFPRILNNTNPENLDLIVQSNFATGKIAETAIETNSGSSSMIPMSFAKLTMDERDGSVLEIFQLVLAFNANTASYSIGRPMVVILRAKKDAIAAGKKLSVGVLDEDDARLIVADAAEVNSNYNILCYHAFGIGEFTVDEAEIKVGGSIKFSNGTADLFYPENIPVLGGDAREILGVTACSLIE